MLSKYVLPGEKVEMQAVERAILGKSVNESIHISKVYDVLSDERIEICMPMEQTKLILLPVGGEYEVCFYTKTGIYQSFARVIDRYKTNGVFILLFELTTNLRKHQRREYYRFNCILNMQSRELSEEEKISCEEQKDIVLEHSLPLRQSIIVDISGGGIRFVSNYQYEKDTIIFLTYTLIYQGKEKNYELTGKILSSKELENRKGQYEHRVQYVNINTSQREEIIRFIFEEERKSRHKLQG
ncbi:MAG: flagellar brake protein [Lachnospiraceae bacterium]|nr:flagellar brake protein [Lachnospiraceae bacterium]